MSYHDPKIESEIKRRAKLGKVIITDHARDREDSRTVDDLEVHRCLKAGRLVGADWNVEHQDNTYSMAINQGSTTRLIVVVALADDHDIVVTVFRREKK
jgi:hypothetical protein